MALAAGTRIGPYEIVAPLGAGGMGEVYRARDTRLGRSAAIKTLPPEFALDEDRRARFEREAKTLATLNHPHIAQIYGLEDVPGPDGDPSTLALAMELVEGEDLAQRLTRGPVPVDDVWPLVRQIAEGLEAAHEAGIVHRDLKPANIRVTPEGVVKVLDFGLAKPMEPVGSGALATQSPTLTSPALTTRGVVLGTASYMAPEQAKGRPVDRRADIFAFGCVVYELLTGQRAFPGEDVPEILGAILKTEPDWSVLPAATPGRVRAVLRRCLAKDRTERWQHIGDVRLAWTEALTEPAPELPPAPAHRASRLGWVVATLAGTVAVGLGAMLMRPTPVPSTPVMRFAIPLADDLQFTNLGRRVLAVSPDGSMVIFVANRRLYRRSLATDEVDAIPGTESRQGVLEPTFSPDGQSIAYVSNDEGTIKTIRIDGGGARVVCAVSAIFGMSWGTTGILFGERDKGILRVPPEGGTPIVVVSTAPPQVAASPHELPNSRWIAFSLSNGEGLDRWERGSIVAYDPATGERRTLVASATDSRLAGRLLIYRSRTTVYSTRLSDDGLASTGPPATLVERVRVALAPDVNPPTGQFDVSAGGTLVYVTGSVLGSEPRRLASVDQNGSAEYLEIEPGNYSAPRVSPDGRLVAYVVGAGTQRSIWIGSLKNGFQPRRLTPDGVSPREPVWSPDGRWIYFGGPPLSNGIWRQPADGSGPAAKLVELPVVAAPGAVSLDGSTLMFSRGTPPNSEWRLASYNVTSREVEVNDGSTSTDWLQPSISSDGRWLAYVVSSGGSRKIFVEPLPRTGARFELPHPLSAGGPVWSPGASRLMFHDVADFWSVDVVTRPSFQFGRPQQVSRGPALMSGAEPRTFDPIPGTATFVAVALPQGQTARPAADENRIHVITNWPALLRQGSDRR